MLLGEKVAVVTGGSQGLGLAIARAFVAEQAYVVLVGRSAERLKLAQQTLVDQGGQVEACCLDVNDPQAGTRLGEVCEARFGRWDILVNCAGTFVYKKFLDLTPVDWQHSLDTNLTAPFRLSQAMVQRLVAVQRQGSVINIGSIHGVLGDANAVPQCASKFGLLGLTKAMAEACREFNVRVNAIAPGAIASESADRLSVSTQARVTQADVAQLATFLASERARFITGSTIDAFGFTRPVIANEV